MSELERWRGGVDAKVESLEHRLSAFETACGSCKTEVNGNITELRNHLSVKIDKVHDRVTKLSNRVFWILGGAVGIGFAAGLGLALLRLWAK